ncbi:MAG: hypothetical protein ABS82_13845 [Rhodanobacter sp. SCN 67-45]|nr:MAG: hypothetical protein ABS82_13845 [Rhodanobacter sp. SCN 67-45]
MPILALILGSTLAASAWAATTVVPPLAAGPWVLEHDASPAFTPDGDTVVFARGNGATRRLFAAHRHDGAWSPAQRVAFSDHWMDLEPAMAPDGRYLVFISNRPANGTGKALDGDWGGQAWPGRGGNLWRVDRVGDGWGTPVRLPDSVNRSSTTFSPAVAGDGSVYFMRANPADGSFRLYVSRREHGHYQNAVALALGTGAGRSDFDPAVAPDQSFLVFSSDRPPAPANGNDLFIAFAVPGGWSAPVDLGLAGSEARLGANRTMLYYTAPDHRIHRVSLAPWLRQRPAR